MKMSNVIKMIIMVLVSACLFYAYQKYYVTHREAKKNIVKLTREKTDKEIDKEMNEEFFGRAAVLLSLKYHVDESRVLDLLVEDTEFNVSREKSMEDGPFKKTKIIEYSKKYSIPTDKIACILLDYSAIKQLEDITNDLSEMNAAQHSGD